MTFTDMHKGDGEGHELDNFEYFFSGCTYVPLRD